MAACFFDVINKHLKLRQSEIPRVQNALDSLLGVKWFTVLDQKNAYHHIYLDGENQSSTDFITLLVLYKWIRVPIGLNNAPGEFHWFMENCLFDIREEYEFPYLDDAMLFSEDFRSYLDHLRIVPQGLEV